MDENSTRPLQYGHLGRAAYDPDTQSWSFGRTLAPAPRISYTGVTKTTVSSPLTIPKSSSTENDGQLPKTYPELAAASSFARNEKLSKAITASSEAYNPLVSSLLDFGHALDLGNAASPSRAIPIAVVASGECGNIVSFKVIGEDIAELKRDMNIQMRVPSIGEETAEWSIGGAPVRQICFSRAVEENATFMAVRFPCSTAIFRPLYHRTPVPVRRNRHFDSATPSSVYNSQLNPNFLVEIPNSRTGGFEHADVTFNPWNQQQLAIADGKGNWGIWELMSREKRSRSNWAAECLKSGSLPWLSIEDGRYIGNQTRHDGWSCIEWVGNDNNIIVCDRRCAILYQIESDSMSSCPIEFGFRRKSEWILYMRRSPCNSSHVFILTTSRIIWLDVTTLHDPMDDGSRPLLYPRLSWRHFRDAEDITLRFALLLMGEDLHLVLYSRLNELVLDYHCPFASEGLTDMFSIPDPFILNIPMSSQHEESFQISPEMTHFSTLIFKEIVHSQSALGANYYQPSLRLLKLFALDSHLAIRESLYLGPPNGSAEDALPPERNILRYTRRVRASRRTKPIPPMDDFIVDDWDEPIHSALDSTYEGALMIAPLALRRWTLDYTQIYSIATGQVRLLSNESESGDAGKLDNGLHSSLKQLEDSLSDTIVNYQTTSQTALEILGSTPVLGDVDRNAHDFSDFALQFVSNGPPFQNRSRFVVQPFDPFSSPSSFHGPSAETLKLDLISIYDRLINDWLANLPQGIPGHTRIAKERVIRSVAADLVLARIITTHGLTPSATPNISHIDLFQSTDQESLFVPSATQGSVLPGEDISPEEGGIPILSTLSSFTTFNNRDSVSSNVERILEQWKPGNNPHEYTSTIQMLGSQAFRPPATPKRKSRKKPSQSTNVDSSQLFPVPPSVPVVRDYGSQPEQHGHASTLRLQSSQVTDDLPMTQIERGAFGGREAARKSVIKARKKKRAAGF